MEIARLSSSPASSPRIFNAPPTRMRSVRPEVSGMVMDDGISPGADFFEDSSGDEERDEGWGDDDDDDTNTRDFSEVEEGLVIQPSVPTQGSQHGNEGEIKAIHRSILTDLPPFNQILAHGSGTITATINNESSSPDNPKGTPNYARQVSLLSLGKVKEVHNHGSMSGSAGRDTSRQRILSNESEDAPEREWSVGELRNGRRRTMSGSVTVDSILNAHVITMRALEALAPTASFPDVYEHARPHSLSLHSEYESKQHRHITLPLHTQLHDSNRPDHLPHHFIKTPYPFASKKEFPKPKVRPRQHSGQGCARDEFVSKKGKHVLGLACDEEEYDFRARLRQDGQAQGVSRMEGESVVWVSLKRGSGAGERLEHIVLPNNLIMTGPARTTRTEANLGQHTTTPVDFDDALFASKLQDAYNSLAGSWVLRLLSACTLRYIQLAHVDLWSGSFYSNEDAKVRGGGRLLAARGGLAIDVEVASPFTEHNLMKLYCDPEAGKARYTWVHWARRLAASHKTTIIQRSHSTWRSRRAMSLDTYTNSELPSPLNPHSTTMPGSVVTIQFVHAFSMLRVLVAVGVMLGLSVLAALLWIFLGLSAWNMLSSRGQAERVGSGMLIGGLVCGIEIVVFLVWLVGSWAWL